jgi:hypothetical protein
MFMPRKGVAYSGVGFQPLSVKRHKMSHLTGRGAPELLLSPYLGTSSIGGGGYGVRTPSHSLMSGLERLSLKKGAGQKRNIRFSF